MTHMTNRSFITLLFRAFLFTCFLHNTQATPSFATQQQPIWQRLVNMTDTCQNTTSWYKPALITASMCTCAVLAGVLLYRYMNPPDEYYITQATNILAKLQKNEKSLLELDERVDKDTIIAALLEITQANADDCGTIQLLDSYLKNTKKEIVKISEQIKKRTKKAAHNGTPNKALENCLTALNAWPSILKKARQVEKKYGCFVTMYQWHKWLSSCHATELTCIKTTASDELDTIVTGKIQAGNTYYDLYVHTIIKDILTLENNLAQCEHINPNHPWIEAARELIIQLEILVATLVITTKYIQATEATIDRAYIRGQRSVTPVYIHTYYPVYTYQTVYRYTTPCYYRY